MLGLHGVAPGTRRTGDDARPFSQVSADKSQRQDLNPQPTAYKAVAQTPVAPMVTCVNTLIGQRPHKLQHAFSTTTFRASLELAMGVTF